MNTSVRPIVIGFCTVLVLIVLGGPAIAGPATSPGRAPAALSTPVPYDSFVSLSDLSSAVQTGCGTCFVVDACIGKKNNDVCYTTPQGHVCHCRHCNGVFDCYP